MKISKIRTRGLGGANFTPEKWVVRISYKWSSVVRISHNALFTCVKCKVVALSNGKNLWFLRVGNDG